MTVRDPPGRIASGFSFAHGGASGNRNGSNVKLFTAATSRALVHGYVEALRRLPSTIQWTKSFGIPQGSYLRHINCDRDELHLLCTERLNEDWAKFAATFGMTALAVPAMLHENNRQNSTLNTAIAQKHPSEGALFDADDGNFLRHQHGSLNKDWLLWLAACGDP